MHLSWQRNIGTADRVIRLLLGLVIIYVATFALSGSLSIVLWILGVVIVVEGLLAY